jgi:hypothetical protein
MMKLSAGLFAAALVIGLGSVPTLIYAEEAATTEEATGSATDSGGDAPKEESKMKKLEEEVIKDLEENKDDPADSIMGSEGGDH